MAAGIIVGTVCTTIFANAKKNAHAIMPAADDDDDADDGDDDRLSYTIEMSACGMCKNGITSRADDSRDAAAGVVLSFSSSLLG